MDVTRGFKFFLHVTAILFLFLYPKYVPQRVQHLTLLLYGLTVFFYFLIISPPKIPNWLKNAATYLFTSIITLVLLEMIFMYVPQSHMFSYSKAIGIWFDYYWYPRNKLGYRDDEVTAADLKKQRILVVGDSFTAGHGLKHVSERYSNQLQTYLPSQYRVFNLGVNGAATQEELNRLTTYPLRPDIVVMQYFANDIDYMGGMAKYNEHWGKNQPKKIIDLRFKWLEYIVDKSYLANFIYWQFPHPSKVNYWQYLKNAYRDSSSLAIHLQDVNKIVNYARANNAPIYMVIFPWMSLPTKESLFYVERLKQYCDSSKVAYIDVSTLIEDLPLSDRTVNKVDSHASSIVNERVAKALYEKMKKSNDIR